MSEHWQTKMAEDKIGEIISGRRFCETRVRHVGEWRLRGQSGHRVMLRPVSIQSAFMMEDYEGQLYPDWQGAPTYTLWEREDGRIARTAADLV